MYVCDPGLQLVGNETLHCTTEDGINGVWSGSPPMCTLPVSTSGEINEGGPSEENTEEKPHSLRNTFIISGVGAAIILICLIAYIIVKRKRKNTHSYNMPLEKQRRDPAVHPQITGDEKQLLPWHSYFCHTTSCHVCPTCEERLHAALDPRAKPTRGDCATCEEWLHGQLGMPRTYSVPSIGSEEIQSLEVTSSLAKATDVLRGDGEAVLEQSKAEWPTAHLSPQRPICAPCADRLHLSLIHGDTAGCPVCPLPGEGTPAHLVPQRIPSCHVCPICAVPTHTHLCQPNGDTLMAAAS
uniref:Complement C3b/C4b receptor 1 like n=1 Tax=Hypotaenidia okinawae TaxID=2861861 RepID=A0A6G1RFJ4_9GRUI